MQQIFINQSVKEQETFIVAGDDARHLSQVLRMRAGENLRVSTQAGDNYLCEIVALNKTEVTLYVLEKMASTELEKRIYLFQAIPKGDRMETVIEKAVELGVYEIAPDGRGHLESDGDYSCQPLSEHCGGGSEAVKTQQHSPNT